MQAKKSAVSIICFIRMIYSTIIRTAKLKTSETAVFIKQYKSRLLSFQPVLLLVSLINYYLKVTIQL